MPTYYIPKREFKVVPFEEIKKYVDAAPDIDAKVFFALAWLTGARGQELCNLKNRPEKILIDNERNDITICIDALKHGKQGFPIFSFGTMFVSDLILPHLAKLPESAKLFLRGRRRYAQILNALNKQIYPGDSSKWITLHYLRHSRITFLARFLKAFPEEIKAWTGHSSAAYEEYFSGRRVERFKDKIR